LRVPFGVLCLLVERLVAVAVSPACADLLGECAELFRERPAVSCVAPEARCFVAAVPRAEAWRPACCFRLDFAAAYRAEPSFAAPKTIH
jgi:hypothetical protein